MTTAAGVRRRLARAIAIIATVVVLAGTAAACEAAAPPPSDPELREALRLDDATPIHEVLLSGQGARTRVLPARITARPGDVVQFRVVDRRVHLVRFPLDELEEDARAFLERTDQASFPPLTERDARLVLSFRGAPVGDYPFVVEGPGEPVEGRIRIAVP